MVDLLAWSLPNLPKVNSGRIRQLFYLELISLHQLKLQCLVCHVIYQKKLPY